MSAFKIIVDLIIFSYVLKIIFPRKPHSVALQRTPLVENQTRIIIIVRSVFEKVAKNTVFFIYFLLSTSKLFCVKLVFLKSLISNGHFENKQIIPTFLVIFDVLGKRKRDFF